MRQEARATTLVRAVDTFVHRCFIKVHHMLQRTSFLLSTRSTAALLYSIAFMREAIPLLVAPARSYQMMVDGFSGAAAVVSDIDYCLLMFCLHSSGAERCYSYWHLPYAVILSGIYGLSSWGYRVRQRLCSGRWGAAGCLPPFARQRGLFWFVCLCLRMLTLQPSANT